MCFETLTSRCRDTLCDKTIEAVHGVLLYNSTALEPLLGVCQKTRILEAARYLRTKNFPPHICIDEFEGYTRFGHLFAGSVFILLFLLFPA